MRNATVTTIAAGVVIPSWTNTSAMAPSTAPTPSGTIAMMKKTMLIPNPAARAATSRCWPKARKIAPRPAMFARWTSRPYPAAIAMSRG